MLFTLEKINFGMFSNWKKKNFKMLVYFLSDDLLLINTIDFWECKFINVTKISLKTGLYYQKIHCKSWSYFIFLQCVEDYIFAVLQYYILK